MLFCGVAWLGGMERAAAIITYQDGPGGTYDPTANTAAPTGDLTDSGWQYEGQFGAYLGTPIAPDFFVSAAHVGNQGSLVYGGVTYPVVAQYLQPNSDVAIYQVSGTFPTYAQIYTGNAVGQTFLDVGRGTQRGAAVTVGTGVSAHVGGWLWGGSDSVQRWGVNTVSQTVSDPTLGMFLVATFDAPGTGDSLGANECTLSVGDSGGGVFVKDTDGVWKLAGINYGVDDPFYTTSTGGGQFYGAMFDTTGLYEDDGMGGYVAADNPAAMYASDLAADIAFIDSVVPEPSSATLCAFAIGASIAAGALRRFRTLSRKR